eukprot:3966397-Prymnesium_polylepis.1
MRLEVAQWEWAIDSENVYFPSAFLYDCHVMHNRAQVEGGGLVNHGLMRCHLTKIYKNSAGRTGGGVLNELLQLPGLACIYMFSANNSEISYNTAGGNGGGLLNGFENADQRFGASCPLKRNVWLVNVTIRLNNASRGAGIANLGSATGTHGHLHMEFCTVERNRLVYQGDEVILAG